MTFFELQRYFDDVYARSLSRWRRKNAYYYKDVVRLLKFYIPEQASVLQIGIDDGWLIKELKPRRGVCLTMSEALADVGRQTHTPGIEYRVDIDEDTIHLDEQFDYILLANSLGSAPDVQTYLERVLPHTNPGTRIVIVYYNYLWQPIIRFAEWAGLKQRQPIQHRLSPFDVENLFELSGFEIIKRGRRMLCPVRIPVFSWILNVAFSRLPLIERLNFYHYAVARPRQATTSRTEYSVSIVVPARNEQGNIESIVKRVPQMGRGTEIVFVEGNSTDKTWDEIRRVASVYGAEKHIIAAQQSGKGKGDAVRKGFQIATGDILMILDADITVPPEDLPKFYHVIASGLAEYVHGTRLVYPMEKEAMRLLNMMANKFFGFAFSWLLKQRLKDTLCGTKVISKHNYERIARNREYFGDFDPFGDFDLIFGASKLGLKMIEIPIHYKQRTYGTTNIQRFRHGLILLRMLFFAIRKFV